MKYNIKPVTDYLAELTGSEVKELAHANRGDAKLPLAITSCYNLCDVEFLETVVTIAILGSLCEISDKDREDEKKTRR